MATTRRPSRARQSGADEGGPAGDAPAAEPSTRALDRGLALLTTLASAGEPLSAPELAKHNDLSRATVYRLLSTLMARRFVAADGDSHRYRLGPQVEMGVVGTETRLALAALSRDEIDALSEETDETVGLHVRIGYNRVAIARVEGSHSLRHVVPIGQQRPLTAGVSGTILMAGMNDEFLREVVAYHAGDETGGRLSYEEIAARTEKARKDGFCDLANDTIDGVAAVSAPILGPGGKVVAALAVSGPVSRFGDRARRAARRSLIATAERIGQTLEL